MKGDKYDEMAYLVWFYAIVAFVLVSVIGAVVRHW